MASVLRAALLWQVLGIVLPGPQPRATAPVIVSPVWLAQHLRDPGIVVIQYGGSGAYARGHIPGSVWLGEGGLESGDMEGGGGMNMNALPSPAELRTTLEALGISDSSHVIVAFTEEDLPQATRAILLMKYAGLVQVSLLDGGVAAWRQNGFPVSTAIPAVVRGRVSGTLDPTTIVDYRYVQDRRRTPHVKLIDARAPVYFDGPQERGSMSMPQGHIPGARNIPYSSLFDEHLHFKPRKEIDRMFRDAGVEVGDTVIAYCHVGIQATVVVLAARLAGHPARMYAGSFHDWSARKLPIEGGRM